MARFIYTLSPCPIGGGGGGVIGLGFTPPFFTIPSLIGVNGGGAGLSVGSVIFLFLPLSGFIYFYGATFY